jgi:hypothetical protein
MWTHKDDLEDQPRTLPAHAISTKATKENEPEFLQNSPLGKMLNTAGHHSADDISVT